MSWKVPPRVVGHRGSPREAAENTLASFRAARRHVRAVELDARLSLDGEVMVHHDAQLGRVIPGEGPLATRRAEELAALGIPRLRDVLALSPSLLVDVELKADTPDAHALPALVWELVREAQARERVLVSSFDHALAAGYARLSGEPAGMIVPFAPEPGDLDAFPALRYVMMADDAAVEDALRACREAGRLVYVWTVDDPARASALLRAGAAGVITDRPGPMARSLGEGASAP